ncbi:ATPase [Peribacillus muralis]|uniref:Nuclease SbcCD subunit C n=1 Tax=Peribacillus muralis TaxID=264697 RepID=A0A1B3XJD1_9BACI|nr:AAA family ATPase [Peribacillus muralis]AOH53326.1 ATPase [Peribacillus muralis]
MQVIFKTLILNNFKSHRDITVNFGERTDITGDNAEGKSTICEAPTYVLYGTDALGSKLDPTPITYEAEEIKVSLLLEVDGKELMLGRSLKKNKTIYYVNEVPSKAGEFNEVVEKLFDKDLFLSLFNPSYFPSMHWEKQRSMLLQYVTSPINKDVIKHMPDEQNKCLAALFKKHNLEDIKKIHAENKNTLEKKYIAAQSRTKTLQERLEQINISNVPLESLKAELAQIDKQVREKESLLDKAWEKNQAYNSLQAKIRNIQDQVEMSKEHWPLLKNEEIEDSCRTCKRPLDEESVTTVKKDKEIRIENYKANHEKLLKERAGLKAQLEEMEFIDVTELRNEIRELDPQGTPLREAIRIHGEFGRLQEQVKQAQTDENETLHSLNESIFILDCVKAFKAKEAELQGEKVQALFETLSVRLFEEQRNGELKNTFEIELDKKPYRKLSTAEGIRAGLELRDVLSQQSDLITPVFVDNAESITSFKQPVGQLIVSRVVAGQKLKIEGVDAE